MLKVYIYRPDRAGNKNIKREYLFDSQDKHIDYVKPEREIKHLPFNRKDYQMEVSA